MFNEEILDIEFKSAKNELLDRFTNWYLENNLKRFHGNVLKTSEHTGISRPTIYKYIRKWCREIDAYGCPK